MGCCVSSATADRKDKLVSGKNRAPSLSVVEEESVVKEVLSETTMLANDNSTVETETTTTISEDEEKKHGAVDVAPDTVLTEPGSEKGSEVCSLSESLLSIVNGYEEEVKQSTPQRMRQRSPAKSRNRVMGNYPVRRTDMSPRKRHAEGGGGGGEGADSARLVLSGNGKRDPIERSERRSKSPAMNRSVVMSPARRQYGSGDGGAAMRKKGQSPGRIRQDPIENGSDQDRHHLPPPSYAVGNYDSTLNDSFENPLVSLECFIFL